MTTSYNNTQQTENNKKIMNKTNSRFKSTTPSNLSLEFFRQTIANKGDSQQKIAEIHGFHNQSSLARFMWGHFIPKKKSTREKYAKIFGVDISLFSELCNKLLEEKNE